VPYLTITEIEVAEQINTVELHLHVAAAIAEEHKVLQTEAVIEVRLHADLHIPGLQIPREVRDTEVRVVVLQGIPVTDRAVALPEVPGIVPAEAAVLPEVQVFGLQAAAVPGVPEV
jgi:hypothetical protein